MHPSKAAVAAIPPKSRELARSLDHVGELLKETGDHAGALAAWEEERDLAQRLETEHPTDVVRSHAEAVGQQRHPRRPDPVAGLQGSEGHDPIRREKMRSGCPDGRRAVAGIRFSERGVPEGERKRMFPRSSSRLAPVIASDVRVFLPAVEVRAGSNGPGTGARIQ